MEPGGQSSPKPDFGGRCRMTERIESFRELKVYWRAAIELQQEIFEGTGSFSKG